MDKKYILKNDGIGVETTLRKALVAFGEDRISRFLVRHRDVSNEFLESNEINSFSLSSIGRAIKRMIGKGER